MITANDMKLLKYLYSKNHIVFANPSPPTGGTSLAKGRIFHSCYKCEFGDRILLYIQFTSIPLHFDLIFDKLIAGLFRLLLYYGKLSILLSNAEAKNFRNNY